MKKSDKRMIIILASVILLVVGWTIIPKAVRERNVFDEMYYSRVHRTFDWFGVSGKNPRTMFSNMPQLEGVTRDNEMIYAQEQCFAEFYKPEFLNENERLKIMCFSNDKEMYITFSYNDIEGHKWYSYCYYVDDKLLVYETNDPDNRERKNFLYEIFLPDWFEANEGISHYSMEHLGKFIFYDTTSDMPE